MKDTIDKAVIETLEELRDLTHAEAESWRTNQQAGDNGYAVYLALEALSRSINRKIDDLQGHL